MNAVWGAILERTRNHLPTSGHPKGIARRDEAPLEAFERDHGWKAAAGAIVLVAGLVFLLGNPYRMGAAVIGQASIAELLALGGVAGAGAPSRWTAVSLARNLERWVFLGRSQTCSLCLRRFRIASGDPG